MDFDLKYFRERVLNMTQAEFADVMGKSQNTVSRWEKEPQNLTLEVLAEISANTGFSLGDILNFKSKIHDPWKGEVSEMEKLRALKSDTNAKLKQLQDYMVVNSNSSQLHKNYADKLQKIYENTLPSIRKPRVGFLGNSDVGKSTLINAMIGQDVLPAGWTPITSLLIYVIHTEDRPDFLGDDSVVVLSNRSGNKRVDIERLHDESYFDQCSIETGGINVLEKYGSREGEYYMSTDATAAVVYIEAPLLKLCTLLDLPGYGTGNPEDDVQAAEGKNNADILVYMSLANGFMHGNDISYLKEVLDSLKPIDTKPNSFEPLSNLFVVASQAHVVADKEELRNILEKGAERMD
ncbi:dynamin family protein, partial [uncultured Trichococcus sp.]|uniref:dynamin family protein n=1 Tax=uncultured Trichococcus sp. TaxID=189665 RepID=UPI002599E2F0